MQYLSEFELLSQPIVPAAGVPAGAKVPFVLQGYFCLISRLADNVAGDLNVELTFFPTPAFPPATGNVATDPLIADFEDETGNNQLNLNFANTITVPIGSGDTVLVGVQPNIANAAIFAAAGQFGVRGYVMIDVANSAAPQGLYQLAAAPEIRATFAQIDPNNPAVDLSTAQEVAYCLPVPNAGLITVTKDKESKEKEQTKDTKDQKDVKDRKETVKDGKESIKDGKKEALKEKENFLETLPQEAVVDQPGLESLSQRIAVLETLVGGSGRTFIAPGQRPAVG